MAREQRIRGVLFYLSLSVFLIGLPFIISFALGLVFDPRTLSFTKTGLIALKTQPAGARVYLNGRLLKESTPATIYELLPARYNVRLELEDYYPWQSMIDVKAGRVVNLDKIIFFPVRPNIQQLNQGAILAFWVEPEENVIYYLDEDGHTIYESDLGGQDTAEIGFLSGVSGPLKGFKVSPDRKKLLCFNQRRIEVATLDADNYFSRAQEAVFDYANRRINDAFWHSDSYHLIVVTGRNIEALEAVPQAKPVNLVTLNKKDVASYYDSAQDILYFEDSQRGEDGRLYDNIYKLDLSHRFSPLKELIKFGTEDHEGK